MSVLRFLNVLLFSLIIVLLLQLVLPKPDNTPLTEGVALKMQSNSVVIPNIPVVTVHNTSENEITIHPCEDVTITHNSVPVTGLDTSTPDFCIPLTVSPGTGKELSLTPLYALFAKASGQYILTLSTEYGNRMASFTVDKPWIFRSLLSWVIYQPIYNLFVAILTLLPGHELGWAIIIVTIIIRFILLVPQQRMFENTQKMNKINPKIQALREEYKNNQAELGMKMMELYKKEWVSPMNSCLPILIQAPILLWLYWVISGISDPSNFYHLYPFFADFNPTHIQTLFFGHDLSSIGGTIGLFAALILWVTQWLQARLSFSYNPIKKPKKSPNDNAVPDNPMMNPQIMQGMMLYLFPFLLGITAFFLPLGVGMYWFVGTIFMIVQQWITHKKSLRQASKGEIVRR